MKRRLLALLLVCLLLPIIATAQEARGAATGDGIIQPFYTLILSIHGTCYIDNGKLAMSGTVTAQGGKADSAKVSITLQYNNGSGWKDGSSWSATGTTSATKQATATPASGTLYRLKIKGTITYNSSSESDTIYTSVVAI